MTLESPRTDVADRCSASRLQIVLVSSHERRMSGDVRGRGESESEAIARKLNGEGAEDFLPFRS